MNKPEPKIEILPPLPPVEPVAGQDIIHAHIERGSSRGSMNLQHCYSCGKELDEIYAVLWGPSDQPASIVGFLCIECSEKPEFTDITNKMIERPPP